MTWALGGSVTPIVVFYLEFCTEEHPDPEQDHTDTGLSVKKRERFGEQRPSFLLFLGKHALYWPCLC